MGMTEDMSKDTHALTQTRSFGIYFTLQNEPGYMLRVQGGEVTCIVICTLKKERQITLESLTLCYVHSGQVIRLDVTYHCLKHLPSRSRL